MYGLPTFVEDDPEPCSPMNYTLLCCEVGRKGVVSCQDNIRIFNNSDIGLALWAVIFGSLERAV
jgi:hypothetical protein